MTGKEAQRAYIKEWREKNRDKVNEYNRNWRNKNPDKFKECQKRYWQRKAELMSEVGIVTNFERIKNMTSAELAEIIMCPYDGEADRSCTRYSNCIDCTRAWLESEAHNGK